VKRRRVLQRLLSGIVLLLLLAAPTAAQEVPADTVPRDTTVRANSGPRNAFIKAMLVPGWGHFSIGSEKRGLFYVALEGSSWFMLVKTLRKLGDAKDRKGEFTLLARDSLDALMAVDSLARQRLEDPVVYDQAVAANPNVASAGKLVTAREQQRQDWIAYTLFFTFLSAVDAYVTAQLSAFPGDITVAPANQGGVLLRVDMPLPAPGRR